MANYDASILLKGQGHLSNAFAKGELRYRDPIVTKNLLQAQAIATPNWEAMKLRDDKTFELDFFNRTSRALGSARSHTHSGAKSDSTVITPSFSTKSDGFYVSIKQMDNKTRTLQEAYNHEFQNSMINFAEGMEVLSSAYLFNNRNSLDHSVNIEGTYNNTHKVFEINDTANGNRAWQIALTRMDILKYQGVSYDVYCNSIAYNRFMTQMAQGQGNSTNLQYQFQNGSATYFHMPEMNTDSLALNSGAYAKGFFLVVPKSTVACLDWIPKQNREGIASPTIGGVAEFGSVYNPILGVNLASHTIWTGFDGTSTGGYTQDVKIDVELSTDISYNKAPLTTATETQIMAFGLV